VTQAIVARKHYSCLGIFVRSDFPWSDWSLKLCVRDVLRFSQVVAHVFSNTGFVLHKMSRSVQGQRLTESHLTRTLPVILETEPKFHTRLNIRSKVSEWVSSFLTAHQHIIGYSVPRSKVKMTTWPARGEYVRCLESWFPVPSHFLHLLQYPADYHLISISGSVVQLSAEILMNTAQYCTMRRPKAKRLSASGGGGKGPQAPWPGARPLDHHACSHSHTRHILNSHKICPGPACPQVMAPALVSKM